MNILFGKNNNQNYKYTYEENRDYTIISNSFLYNTLKALDFLHKTNALTISYKDEGIKKTVDIIDLLTDDIKNNIIIKHDKKNTYNHITNTITFYDTHGIAFRKNHRKRFFGKNKGYNSPVCVLSHELIHCYNELYETEDYHTRRKNTTTKGKKKDQAGNDISYPNKEEQFVIRMTNQVAKKLKEDIRTNYGISYYEVINVLSTKRKKSITNLLKKILRKNK